MRLSVIGCGYLGAVHAACMADLGHDVVGIDVDAARVASLAAGRPPFHEPGFGELLTRALATGRLRFSTEMSEVAQAQVASQFLRSTEHLQAVIDGYYATFL